MKAVLLVALLVSISASEDSLDQNGRLNVPGKILSLRNIAAPLSGLIPKTSPKALLFNPTQLFSQVLTSTVFVTSTSTITSVSAVRCIAASLFASGVSTLTCRRRRGFRDEGLDDILENFKFTPVIDVVPSALPASISEPEVSEPVIRSSQDEDSAIEFRRGRNIVLYAVVTVTSTALSYTVVSSTYTARATPIATVSSLSCLPFGYTAC